MPVGGNYDHKLPDNLSVPHDPNYIYAKFYVDSKKHFNQKFEPKNEIDRQITLGGRALQNWNDNNNAHSLALRYATGFPGIEDERVIRVETKYGFCRNYDCTVDAMERKNSRSERHYPRLAKLEEEWHYKFSFYIPEEGNILDGTENLHITQFHGGNEEIPSWIGIAPYQRQQKEYEIPRTTNKRVVDENGIEVTKRLVRFADRTEDFNPWGSGIAQVDDDTQTGDLVVFFRSIFGLDDHVSRYMYKLADAEDIKGKWHTVDITIKWSRNDNSGYMKYVFNNKTILECNPCRTMPDHQFSLVGSFKNKVKFNVGAYRWINGNVLQRGGTYGHKPRDVVIYYKEISLGRQTNKN